MLDSIKLWIDKAKEDEQVARLIEDAGRPLNLAGYHLQQAAEKRLKARLVQVGKKPAKTHDLVALATELSVDIPEAVWESLSSLSILGWTTRYPGFDELDSSRYVLISAEYENVVSWLEALE